MLNRKTSIEKRRVDLGGFAFFRAHLGIGHARRAFDDKAKILIHLRRKRRVLAGGQRPPEGAIHTDGAQQWVLVIGRQALLGQHFFGVSAVPDKALPAGVGPGGSAKTKIAGKLGRQFAVLGGFGGNA